MTNLAKYSAPLYLSDAMVLFIQRQAGAALRDKRPVEIEVLWAAFSLGKPEAPCVPVETKTVAEFAAWLSQECQPLQAVGSV